MNSGKKTAPPNVRHSLFSILEKLLGYDASTLELNTSPDRFFDIFIKNTAQR